MTRRLTVAILLLVAATLIVASLGSYLFVRRAAVSTAQQELVGQGRAISTTISNGTFPTTVSFQRELRVIRGAGDFQSLVVVELHDDGTVTGTLPPGITARMLNVPALLTGHQTAGHTRHLLVYTAVPTPITGVTAYTPLLVVTRQGPNPANGLRYYLLVGAVALVAAAVLALVLARQVHRAAAVRLGDHPPDRGRRSRGHHAPDPPLPGVHRAGDLHQRHGLDPRPGA